MALVRSDRLTATERSMLLALKARALAGMRDHQRTRRCIAAADERFALNRPAEDPPTITHHDAAEHAGETGHALAEAALRLRGAASLHGQEFARSRAFCELRLAALLLDTGHVDEALAVTVPAVDNAAAVRSHRLAIVAGQVDTVAGGYRDIPEIADLRQRPVSLHL